MKETLGVIGSVSRRKLRATLRSTNPIESTFDKVEVVCRNVKRWQGGDQYLRWVASGLLWRSRDGTAFMVIVRFPFSSRSWNLSS